MRKKVLIIDDDDAIVDAIQMILHMEGYETYISSEYITIQEIEKECPDVILLDIWMSGIDGRTICRQLKANKKTKKIRVILVSAAKDIERNAKLAGADDFIAKPFDIEKLLAKVAA